MNSYFVMTRAITGKRGAAFSEKWIVSAGDMDHAVMKALERAHPGAKLVEVELVEDAKRISVGS